MTGLKWSFAFLAATSLLALILCPHSKVEESFHLHATYDLYYNGISPALRKLTGIDKNPVLPYDHIQYPGVVPRSFAGAFVLSNATRWIGWIIFPVYSIWDHPHMVLFICRLLLLSANLSGLYRMADAASVRYGSATGMYFLLLSGCQFHIPFYGSRMLPNSFALAFVTHAYADWMRNSSGSNNRVERAAIKLVVAASVFRCDIIVLLFTIGLTWLFVKRELTIFKALRIGILTGACSLMATVPLDTLLWGRLVWPEGVVLFFNTVQNKSSEWGTEPWNWYFARALPRAMLLTLFLVPFGFVNLDALKYKIVTFTKRVCKPRSKTSFADTSIIDACLVSFVVPVVAFIGLYSVLPHKEVRFIFPALPMLNLAAAYGLSKLHKQATIGEKGKQPPSWSKLMLVCGWNTMILTYLGSLIFLEVSRHNYPGGDSLELLSKHIAPSVNKEMVRVHVDVAAAMSGVSLFGQRASALSFDKGGYEVENTLFNYGEYTHLLSETKEVKGFHVLDVAKGYPRLDFRRMRISTRDAIFVLECNDWTR